jgi:hypothetical protein
MQGSLSEGQIPCSSTLRSTKIPGQAGFEGDARGIALLLVSS